MPPCTDRTRRAPLPAAPAACPRRLLCAAPLRTTVPSTLPGTVTPRICKWSRTIQKHRISTGGRAIPAALGRWTLCQRRPSSLAHLVGWLALLAQGWERVACFCPACCCSACCCWASGARLRFCWLLGCSAVTTRCSSRRPFLRRATLPALVAVSGSLALTPKLSALLRGHARPAAAPPAPCHLAG
jgi:hypothetical protein